jgi:hypothetical protein
VVTLVLVVVPEICCYLEFIEVCNLPIIAGYDVDVAKLFPLGTFRAKNTERDFGMVKLFY